MLFWVYVILALPYAYRALAAGLNAIDVKTLSEAARSLGASWFTVIVRVIVPNMRQGMLNAVLLTCALVLGEFTIAYLLLYTNLQVELYSISRNTPNAGVLFSTSFAALLFAFVLLLILSYAGRAVAAAGDEVPLVTSSPVTRARDRAARAAVEVRLEGLSRHYGSGGRARPARPDPGARRARRAARPVGLRQDHHAAPARRAGGRRRRPGHRRRAGTSPTCRPTSATWAWCSRPTRCSRT